MLELKDTQNIPDLPIGCIFKYKGNTMIVEKHTNSRSMCTECDLYQTDACIHAVCMCIMRSDNTPVYFKKVK